MSRPILILDNGANTAKFGSCVDKIPRIVPNCVIKAKNVRNRIFIGDQIDDCKDLSSLYYLLPFQKGYLTNWEVEKQLWDHLFGKDGTKVTANESSIIITEPYFNFQSVQEAITEILFEEYQFQSICRMNPSDLSAHRYVTTQTHKPLCCLIVDSGYSFTHLIPYCQGKKIKDKIRRINIGGKILTNHLKEVISYRQLMVMDETYVINQCKEDVCYVSTQFWKDMEIARKKGKANTVTREYVLPDYTHIKRGHIKPLDEIVEKPKGSEQTVRMNNERFSIPEVLFHPSDIGIQEMGVTEAIIHTINLMPEEMQPHFYSNIVLTGGNCTIPGFRDRVFMDVRSMAPDDYDVNVYLPDSPMTYSWEGGAMLAKSPDLKKMIMTRQMYDDHGPYLEKFDV